MRAVVLSPHLDDAVLSLGATLHRAARSGWDVTVLTVLAGDPASDEPAGSWDAETGFATAGEAARARRVEDQAACATLGVRPVWLPFVEWSYGRPAAAEVWPAVAGHLADAERVLLPGFPLEHADHVWLTRLALTRLAPGPLVGLYLEQPYALRKLGRPRVADTARDLAGGRARWVVSRSSAGDRRAKLRACRAYRSQRPRLARSDPLMLTRIALADAWRRGEWVAWLGGAGGPAGPEGGLRGAACAPPGSVVRWSTGGRGSGGDPGRREQDEGDRKQGDLTLEPRRVGEWPAHGRVNGLPADELPAAGLPSRSAVAAARLRRGPWMPGGRGAARTRVLAVVGTRPEAIKMFSPLRALQERDTAFETLLCSSGQHRELLADALATFGLTVDYDLAAMRRDQDPAEIAWMVAPWITALCRRLRPDVVLVQGDTTTTMAAGLAAFYSSAFVAHVEAGLRTYDNAAPWPEEANRRIVGAVADVHFAPSELAAANLRREGAPPDRVHVTGNTGIDALHWALSRVPATPAPEDGERRVMVTAHRRESIPDGVESIVRAVRQLAERYPDVRFQFVVHPAPSIERALAEALDGHRPRNVELLTPCDYVSYVGILAGSFLILTDSGGIQEEAPALRKPVLVVNRRTERHEPLAAGTACVVGTAEQDIVAAAARLLDDPVHYARMAARHEPYGDGHAGERIATVLTSFAHSFRREEARAP